jgi:DNA-binding FadR family transcriptional regulator
MSDAGDLPDAPLLPGQSLTFGIVEALGRAIVSGRITGREFPTEAELVRRFGASPSVVRGAVKMLTAKGLLSARPRLGTVVEPHAYWRLFDPDVLRWLVARPASCELVGQFTEMRLAFEPEAAGLASQRSTPAAREAIRAAVERLNAAAIGAAEPTTAEAAFHVAVLDAAENPFFSQLTSFVVTATELSAQLARRYRLAPEDLPNRQLAAEAVLAGDAADARDRMRTLLLAEKGRVERLAAAR